MRDTLILLSFAAGLIPASITFFLYAFRTRWNDTDTGRGMFALIGITVVSYALSFATLMWPEIFNEEIGEWIRIGARFTIALVLWNLLRIFLKAQREPHSDNTSEGNHHEVPEQ